MPRWVPALALVAVLALFTGGAAAKHSSVGLRPGAELAAMRTAIAAAPGYFPGFDSHCTRTTAVLAWVSGPVLAGNFRDDNGGCYVWLNLSSASMLSAAEICKTTLHEMGHLTGLAHSPDPASVMYSPFTPSPIPPPCTPRAQSSAHGF